jgi:hypothetical protein
MKLLNLFNWVESLIGFFTFNLGGDPPSPGPTTSTNTSYSTNLPEYAQPYYTELMKQASKAIYSTDPSGNVTGVAPYQQFGGTTQLAGGQTSTPGQRIAGFTPGQQAVQQQVAGLQTPGQFGASTQGLGVGSQMGLGAGLQGLNQAFAYNPSNVPVFGQGAANYYMNPYQQNVTDIALREARQQGDIQKQQGALGAIGRGTFGGARQALIQAEQGRNLNRQLSDIQAQGSQQGYLNAQQQFNADVARQQQAQQFGATLGQQIGLSGLTAGLQGSQALGALGAQQQTADLSRLQAQDVSAAQQQALQQQQLNQAYQDWQTSQNYPKSQLEYLNNILRGNAGALGSTQVAYTPAPSNASQLASLGLAGLGLYSALGKGIG